MKPRLSRSVIRTATLTLATLTPLPFALTAQADEPSYRSSESYDDGYNPDYDQRNVRLPGEVTRISGRDSIELRSGRRYYSVRLKGDADATFLNIGDYVILRGEWSGDHFVADDLGRGRADDWDRDADSRTGDARKVDFSATVSRIFSSHEVEVRGDNGRYYRLDVRSGVSGFTPNAKVRVVGESNGQRVQVERLYWAGGSVNPGWPGYIARVDFPARVEWVDTARGIASVRADNGKSYIVRPRSFSGLRRGDRVRVAGNYRNGVVEGASVITTG
jgi:hypothetical protein